MFTRISQLSLTSIALVLSTGLTSLAQTATVQSGTQTATVSGDNNQVNQIIYQIQHPGRGRVSSVKPKEKNERGVQTSNNHRNERAGQHPQTTHDDD